jgi:hypothetical protein
LLRTESRLISKRAQWIDFCAESKKLTSASSHFSCGQNHTLISPRAAAEIICVSAFVVSFPFSERGLKLKLILLRRKIRTNKIIIDAIKDLRIKERKKERIINLLFS